MSQVIKDFARGAVVSVAGVCALIVVFALVPVLGVVLHIIGALLSIAVSAGIVLLCVWAIGFLYRKIREMKTE